MIRFRNRLDVQRKVVIAALLAASAGRLQAAAGLSAVGAAHVFESSAHPIYTPAANEAFGIALATGDFNGDGVADLAIGAQLDRHLFSPDPVGAVQIRYGLAGSGLPTGIFVDIIWQGGASSIDPAEALDRFGCTLAAGNFDGDLYDDLAVGVCHEDLGDDEDAGAVEIHYGGPAGLTHSGVRQFIHQDTAGLADAPEDFDRFGEALAAGDFDADGFDDLAIGTPLEGVDDHPQNGLVQVLYGSAAGISTSGSDRFDASELGYTAGDFFHFGQALASADFNGDTYDDLAIGTPGRNGVGALFVVDGGADGLGKIPAVYLHQAISGVEDVPEAGDRFGSSLVAGHFGGSDPYADLAVGVPLEDLGPGNEIADVGCVHLFFGTEDGLTAAGSQYWSFASAISGNPEAYDRFGAALTTGDFHQDGFADLAIGVPGDRILAATDVGAVVVLRGTSLGPTSGGATIWSFQSPGMPGDSSSGDELGTTLAAADFDGDGHDELVIGAPGDDTEAIDAGSVLLIRGSLFADGFEGFDPFAVWTTGP